MSINDWGASAHRVRQLVIIGAGGFAKSALDSMDQREYRIAGFVDERPDKESHLGYPVLAHSLDALEGAGRYSYFVAIGDCATRKRWFDELVARGLDVVSIVDRTALVSPMATVGRGCFIGKMAVVDSDAVVGDDCVINTMALVEHGCEVGDHANLATKAVVNGDVSVGEGTFLGSCASVIGQRSVGAWSVVGAGAVVVRDVPDGVTVVGVPARVVSKEDR